MTEDSLEMSLKGLEATRALGLAIAELVLKMKSGIIITLSGNLGAGKTTLVKSIGAGLGVKETIQSPTFTMINEYHSGVIPLYHFDFYRVMDSGSNLDLSLTAMDFDDLASKRALLVVERPEYFLVEESNYLAEYPRLSISLSYKKDGEDDERCVRIQALSGLEESKSLIDGLSGLAAI